MASAIRNSASLIIAAPVLKRVVHGSNYKVLLMKRNTKSSFINAHVYPGGVVDDIDYYRNWTKSNVTDQEGDVLTYKICAIRETFEESGLLLCHNGKSIGKEALIDWRDRVQEDAKEFKKMCDQYKLFPSVDQLVPFTNWITPTFEKKRYNTLFFLTVLRDLDMHSVLSDGKETVSFDWFRPEEALEEHKEKKMILIPPQWYSLNELKKVPNVEDIESKAAVNVFRTESNEIVKILPFLESTPEDSVEAKEGYLKYLVYPGDELYQSREYKSEKGNRHRLYFKGRMEEFKLDRKYTNVI